MATWIERLQSGEPVAGEIVDSLGPDEITEIATDPTIRWSLLAEQEERDAAILLFEYRMQALVDGGDLVTALRDLEESVVVRDASKDLRLESLAVRVAIGLVFFDPPRADDLCERFWRAHIPSWDFEVRMLAEESPEHTDGYQERAELLCLYLHYRSAYQLASQWFAVRERVTIPQPLERFVAVQWVASRSLLDELLADLRHDMGERSEIYLEVFDAIAGSHHRLLSFIMQLSERFSHEAPSSPGDLGEEEREMLVSAIEQIEQPMARPGRALLLPGLLTAVCAGALLSLDGHDMAALGVMVALGAATAMYSTRVARGQYARLVRPRLAAYLAKAGTPVRCITSWLGQNRDTFRKLEAFNPVIHRDRALEAIARLGRMTQLDRDVAL